jgi:hypothetical protein
MAQDAELVEGRVHVDSDTFYDLLDGKASSDRMFL